MGVVIIIYAWLTRYSGANSPNIDSAVILLSSNSPYEDAVAGCKALGEELWSPENAPASIQSNLDYLVYEGKATKQSNFWVAAQGRTTRAISASGEVSSVSSSLTLPALCTQSAPLANLSTVGTESEWQVSVHSNNEELVGSVHIPSKPIRVRPSVLTDSSQFSGSHLIPFLRSSVCFPAGAIHLLYALCRFQ